MKFEISHELDATIDALELAMMSPDLARQLLAAVDSMASIDVQSHDVADATFRRVWRFQAKAPLRALSSYEVTREMMVWDEVFEYDRRAHAGTFHIVPRPGVDPDAAWRQRIDSGGSYRLDALKEGRTRRTVIGTMAINVRMIGPVVERLAVAELRKAYAAEAEALLRLCSLV